MVKTKIIETTEKYDSTGALIEKTVREETSEEDTVYQPFSWQPDYNVVDYTSKYGVTNQPVCTVTASNGCGGHEC